VATPKGVAGDAGRRAAVTVVAHPFPLFRAGIVASLEPLPECDPVIGVSSLAEVPAAIAPDTDGLCVCSTVLDEADLRGVAALRVRRPRVRMLLLLAEPTSSVSVPVALAAGVSAVLEPQISSEDLAVAVRTARAGRVTLTPGLPTGADPSVDGIIPLTRRERQVLDLMGRGLGNRAIAGELFISENTVRNHVRRVYEKLDVGSRTEAVIRAAREGILTIQGPSQGPGQGPSQVPAQGAGQVPAQGAGQDPAI
jgi:DNA-binding NarL/FixJ family response regulator